MKLVFTKLETDANEIRVTFDGLTWRPYSVADIKRTGYIEFTEEDCPDLTKIKIKGKFARFTSVESVSDVELEQGLASRSLAESVQRINSFIPSTVSNTNKLVDESTLNDSFAVKAFNQTKTDILAYALTCDTSKRSMVRIHSTDATNNPFGVMSDTDFVYTIDKIDDKSNWISIQAKDVRTNRMFVNTKNDVQWIGWREI